MYTKGTIFFCEMTLILLYLSQWICLQIWHSNASVLDVRYVWYNTKYCCNFSGIWYCKIFFVWGWFLLQRIEEGGWHQVRGRTESVQTIQTFARQFLDAISSAQLLATHETFFFLLQSPYEDVTNYLLFIMHSILHELRSLRELRSLHTVGTKTVA